MRDNRKLSCQCLQESNQLIHFFIGKGTPQLALTHNPDCLFQSFCRSVVKIGISQFHIPKGCHPEYVPVSRVASDFVPAQICTFFIFCMGKRSKGSPTKKRAVVARDTASGFKKLKSGQLLCCQCILVSFKVVIKRRTMGNQCSLKRSDRLGQVIKRKWLFFVGESFFKIWPVTRNLQSFHRLFRCQVHLHVSLNRAYSLLLQRCSSPSHTPLFHKSKIGRAH